VSAAWRAPVLRRVALLALAALMASACAVVSTRIAPSPPALRIAQVADEGDAARRASTRLLIEGLRADAAGDGLRAKGHYERALALDPTNPYAYLAYARYELALRELDQASRFLARARSFFEAEAGERAGVARSADAHLLGLRGAIEREAAGGEAGAALLERARELDPAAWSDARLDAAELL